MTLEEDPLKGCPLPVVWGHHRSLARPAADIDHSDWLEYDKKDRNERREKKIKGEGNMEKCLKGMWERWMRRKEEKKKREEKGKEKKRRKEER